MISLRKDEIRIRRELFRQTDRKDLWSALWEEHAKETLKGMVFLSAVSGRSSQNEAVCDYAHMALYPVAILP